MNLSELFIQLMDQIYWVGYAIQLAQDDPEKYTWEFNEFLNTYGSGLKRS